MGFELYSLINCLQKADDLTTAKAYHLPTNSGHSCCCIISWKCRRSLMRCTSKWLSIRYSFVTKDNCHKAVIEGLPLPKLFTSVLGLSIPVPTNWLGVFIIKWPGEHTDNSHLKTSKMTSESWQFVIVETWTLKDMERWHGSIIHDTHKFFGTT